LGLKLKNQQKDDNQKPSALVTIQKEQELNDGVDKNSAAPDEVPENNLYV
jgi:hypothetical protein